MQGVPSWHSRLRIWHCYCSGSASNLWPKNPDMLQMQPKKKNVFRFWVIMTCQCSFINSNNQASEILYSHTDRILVTKAAKSTARPIVQKIHYLFLKK